LPDNPEPKPEPTQWKQAIDFENFEAFRSFIPDAVSANSYIGTDTPAIYLARVSWPGVKPYLAHLIAVGADLRLNTKTSLGSGQTIGKVAAWKRNFKYGAIRKVTEDNVYDLLVKINDGTSDIDPTKVWKGRIPGISYISSLTRAAVGTTAATLALGTGGLALGAILAAASSPRRSPYGRRTTRRRGLARLFGGRRTKKSILINK
jgi:hypothetical protein